VEIDKIRLKNLKLYKTKLVLLSFFVKRECRGITKWKENAYLSNKNQSTWVHFQTAIFRIGRKIDMDFAGKVVLVTGGSRGIGAAVVRSFSKSGADVFFTYRSARKQAKSILKEVRKEGGRIEAVQARVENASDVKLVVKKVQKEFAKIDVLVNNAGIWKRGEIGSMSEKEWDETLDINLKGTFLFCNEVVPIMKAQKGGKIINISSTAGQRGEPHYSHYAASKGGMIAFTKAIGAELARFGINVNSVAPGWVETDMTSDTLRNKRTRFEIDEAIPRGKVARPEDIAGSVLFLASDLSKHIVGATLNVNGGSVLF
jgi:3-oxoacyl-[acyl-carrier protein] reductase